MKNKQLPWYPMYPRDWALSQTTLSMTYEEQGIFRALMDSQWLEGAIPCESQEIIKILSTKGQVSVTLESSVNHVVVKAFPLFGKYRQNPRLRQIAREQRQQYQGLSERAQKANKVRWKGKAPDPQGVHKESLPPPQGSHSESESEQNRTKQIQIRTDAKRPSDVGLTTSKSKSKTEHPWDIGGRSVMDTGIPFSLADYIAKKIPEP